MQVRPAEWFSYKPRQPDPFKSTQSPVQILHEENPLGEQAFEVAHVGTDIFLDYAHSGAASTVGGVAAGAVALMGLGWGLSRLRSEAWPDKVAGVGHLALASASTLHAVEHLAHLHVPHAAIGAFEVVHGLASMGLGLSELMRATREGGSLERKLVGAGELAMGAAITGAGLFGHLAPALHIVAAGALAVKEVALNKDRLLR
ncbi:MAG: hypothetical protein AMXMBFR33_23170 [Candidatus Xenobia bacterium]